MYIYYDSKTGNVQRFVKKMERQRSDWHFIKIDPNLKIENEGHFLTFTTKIGEVPETTDKFLENENPNLLQISFITDNLYKSISNSLS